MKRAAHEKSVREGLEDTSDGSLGDKLRLWNEEYFSKNGLFVHLELSESAMKYHGREKTFRKPTSFFKGEERDRKKEERKFVIVVTNLDAAGEPSQAIKEIAAGEGVPVEIGSSEEPVEVSKLPAEMPPPAVELPAEMPPTAVELPADIPSEGSVAEKKFNVSLPDGVVEMSSDNSHVLEKMNLKHSMLENEGQKDRLSDTGSRGPSDGDKT
jgi:hypothetical protein